MFPLFFIHLYRVLFLSDIIFFLPEGNSSAFCGGWGGDTLCLWWWICSSFVWLKSFFFILPCFKEMFLLCMDGIIGWPFFSSCILRRLLNCFINWIIQIRSLISPWFLFFVRNVSFFLATFKIYCLSLFLSKLIMMWFIIFLMIFVLGFCWNPCNCGFVVSIKFRKKLSLYLQTCFLSCLLSPLFYRLQLHM